MSFAGSRRRSVEEQLDALRDEFGDFDVRTEAVEVSREVFSDTVAVAERRALGGARAVVEHDDAVLLVRERDDAAWDVPGRDRKPGESYATAAKRYVYEQAGVECRLTSIHFVLRYEFTLVEGVEGSTGLWVVFGAETAAPSLDVGDVASAEWFDVDDLPENTAADVRALLD